MRRELVKQIENVKEKERQFKIQMNEDKTQYMIVGEKNIDRKNIGYRQWGVTILCTEKEHVRGGIFEGNQ